MKTKSYEISIKGSPNKYVYIVVPESQTDKFIQELSNCDSVKVLELDKSITEAHTKLGEIYEAEVSS